MIAVGIFHTLQYMTTKFGDPSRLVVSTQIVNHLSGTCQTSLRYSDEALVPFEGPCSRIYQAKAQLDDPVEFLRS
jgi:hypothetical protein